MDTMTPALTAHRRVCIIATADFTVTTGGERPVIEVREAVEAAKEFAREVFEYEDLKYLRLEEIELSRDEEYWEVTLGWVTPEDARRSTSGIALVKGATELPRTYKTFHVNAETGEVESMKIRNA